MTRTDHYAGVTAVTDADRPYLDRCVTLAETALAGGDEPFGSVLVAADGAVLAEDHNRVAGGDHTRHPEFALARWAAEHLSPDARAEATVYTSGEHCPMCAAAHAWVGLGPIVYAGSAAQLADWTAAAGADPAPVAPLPIRTVAPGAVVRGPDPRLSDRLRALHLRRIDRDR